MRVFEEKEFDNLVICIHMRNASHEVLSKDNPIRNEAPSLRVIYNFIHPGVNHFGNKNFGYSDVIILSNFPVSIVEDGLHIAISLLCTLKKETDGIAKDDLKKLNDLAAEEIKQYIYDNSLVDIHGSLLKVPPITPFNKDF
jgi:hypothetical protein